MVDSPKKERLYHFTAAKHALEDIARQRLKIAQFSDLNDPLELMCVDLLREGHEVAFAGFKEQMAKIYGVLCFSKEWKNILLWSHYGERHQGICLAFDVTNFGSKFGPVEYRSRKHPFPPVEKLDERFMWKVLRTKYLRWQYEEEWRVFLRLDTPEWNEWAKRDLYFAAFSGELVLREVILGAENTNSANEIRDALNGYADPVQVSKIRLSPSEFSLQKYEV